MMPWSLSSYLSCSVYCRSAIYGITPNDVRRLFDINMWTSKSRARAPSNELATTICPSQASMSWLCVIGFCWLCYPWEAIASTLFPNILWLKTSKTESRSHSSVSMWDAAVMLITKLKASKHEGHGKWPWVHTIWRTLKSSRGHSLPNLACEIVCSVILLSESWSCTETERSPWQLLSIFQLCYFEITSGPF